MSAHGDRWVSADGVIELRCGDYRDVLADIGVVDTVITDPPYSESTHSGSDAVVAIDGDYAYRRALGYRAWSVDDVSHFVDRFAGINGWMAAFTDSWLSMHWRSRCGDAGRYTFAPVPILQHRPRLGGDGPGSGAVYLMVSRPRSREFLRWGSLPCWYGSRTAKSEVMGAKPLDLMRAIVRDYSRPGNLVCDPCAGSGTTLLAAAAEGRRAIGAEIDPETFALAVDRLRGWGPGITKDGAQANLFTGMVR